MRDTKKRKSSITVQVKSLFGSNVFTIDKLETPKIKIIKVSNTFFSISPGSSKMPQNLQTVFFIYYFLFLILGCYKNLRTLQREHLDKHIKAFHPTPVTDTLTSSNQSSFTYLLSPLDHAIRKPIYKINQKFNIIIKV